MMNLKLTLGQKTEKTLGHDALKLTNAKKLRVVVMRSLNRTAVSSKARMDKEIRAEMLIKQRDVKERIKINKASTSRLESIVTISGKGCFPLSYFTPKVTPMGVSVHMFKKIGRKGIAPGPIRRGGRTIILSTSKGASATWIAKGHVMARAEGKNHPIILYGASSTAILLRDEVQKRLKGGAETTLIKELRRQADYELGKLW